MNQLDIKNDFAKISIDQTMDKERGSKIIRDMVKKFLPKDSREIKDEDFPSYIAIHDRNEYDLILSAGWLKKVFLKRIVKAGDTEQIETCEILIRQ